MSLAEKGILTRIKRIDSHHLHNFQKLTFTEKYTERFFIDLFRHQEREVYKDMVSIR